MLSDILMPVLSGIQLARRVKEINPSIKVVLRISRDKRKEFSKIFPSVHIDGFVQEPICIGELTNMI
jgi:CheY-like chemotaxis protein